MFEREWRGRLGTVWRRSLASCWDRERDQRDQPGMSLIQAETEVIEEKEEEKAKTKTSARREEKSWGILGRWTSQRLFALREICPETRIFGTGGIRQPRLLGPTDQAE